MTSGASLACPAYIVQARSPQLPLRYVWDDTRASKDFRSSGAWVLEAARGLCPRARLVLCVGLYEWVMWRFDGLHDDPRPLQFAEAAWCGTIDPRFMRFFELDRTDWLGPVAGPLWCAITWLRPALADGDSRPQEVDEALHYLTRLAVHVMPRPDDFRAWLQTTLARLVEAFPAFPDDPFEDLFDRYPGVRRGPWIDRRALDPDEPAVGEEEAIRWLRLVCVDALANGNPYVQRLVRQDSVAPEGAIR